VIIYQTRLSKFITGVPDANCESNYLLKEQDISRLRILSCLSETLNFLSRLIPHKEKNLRTSGNRNPTMQLSKLFTVR
jgi:hypothetical protein